MDKGEPWTDTATMPIDMTAILTALPDAPDA